MSSFLEDLANRTPGELAGELDAIRARRAQLELEEQVVSQALRLLQYAEDGVPGAQATVNALKSKAADASPGTIIGNIAAVLRQGPNQLHDTGSIRAALADRGVDATANATRVALRRLVARGEAERVGDRYRASTQPAVLRLNGGS